MPKSKLKLAFFTKVNLVVFLLVFFFVESSFGRGGVTLYSLGNNLAWNSTGTWSLSNNGSASGLIPQANDTVVINCILVQNVNFSFSEYGQLLVLNSGLLKGENLDLNFSGNSLLKCSGEIKTGNLGFSENSSFFIDPIGKVSVKKSLTHNSINTNHISGKLTVTNNFSVSQLSVVEGNGTIEAASFVGSGSVFSICPVSKVPTGSLISENNWIGTLNNDWNDPSNWMSGNVPDEYSNISILVSAYNPHYTGNAVYNNVYINSQAVLSVFPSAVIEITGTLSQIGTGKLILKNTISEKSSLLADGEVIGKIQSEYPVVAGQNILVSSPVDMAMSGTFLNMYLRLYDESASQWGEYIVPTEDPLQVMRGYEVYSLFSETRVFEGTPNMESKTFQISNSGNGLNLTGNPFPSYIDWESNDNDCWDRNSVAAAIYYPDPSGSGNFSVYLPGGDASVSVNNGSRYIAPMQGFFVKATQQAGTLTVKENSRVRNFNDSRVSLQNNSVKFRLSDSDGLSDEAVLRVIANSTFQFDDEFDALKLTGNTNSPSIQLESEDDIKYAVSTIPAINSSLDIPLDIHSQQAGMFTISVAGSFNFEYRYPVILEDKELEKFIDLRTDSVYTFYHTPEMSSERFEIHFNSPEGIDQNSDMITEMIVMPGIVRITGTNNNVFTANLFTIEGRLVNTSKGVLSEGISLSTNNQTGGIYLLQLSDGKHAITKKIYMK